MHAILEEIYKAVIAGNREDTSEKVQQAITENLPPGDILQRALIAAMTEVGDRFEQGEFYVPEMLVAARAMQSGLSVLKPLLLEADLQPAGKVVLGTVKGDLHDIGKNLVGMMLEGAGFEIIDLGSDVPPEKFAAAVRENSADIVGMSALLTTTMTAMEEALEALEDLGVRADVKVIIGGAPVTDAYAQKIGADGFAADASRAVKLAQSLMGQSQFT